ncbi:uncharacterized protein LOC114330278 [Diabrotica virgifera virgifera]|uniref:Uncharacterized protein LOC114330278 n=1 Tax=Diabrotica virgifera virgifera TaxID=50390 RepID=A0A6P7FRA6_DIAVI|nr:uncharacterized protein LOC114330278 [Diabrotica virgifera virgifera]
MSGYTKILLLASLYTFLGAAAVEYKTDLKYIQAEKHYPLPEFNSDGVAFDRLVADQSQGIEDNNNGNYGDLVFKERGQRDQLLFREVLINNGKSSAPQDLIWIANIPETTISSVRCLNFGRERAFCYSIEVAGGDTRVVLKLGAFVDPRVMIEVYGYN